MTEATEAFERLREGFDQDKEWFGRGLALGLPSLMEGTMWVLRPGPLGWQYEKRKQGIEAERDANLQRVREEAEWELHRLFLQYHEEVPGAEADEPTYPLRGGAEWRRA